MLFSFLSLFLALASSRRRPGKRYTKDNDPVRYMRELEFRNTIDQYDLALVLFYDKDNDDCKRMIEGYRYAAERSHGKADYIVLSARHATDLADELGVDTYPALFAFRYGTQIAKLPNTTQGREAYFYVCNVTASKYKYVNQVDEARSIVEKMNATIIVALPDINAKLDKILSIVSAKFMKKSHMWVTQTAELADAFNAPFPGITIIRTQDDKNISYPGDPFKITTKSLSDFIEKNIDSKYEIMNSTFNAVSNDNKAMYFATIYDFSNLTMMAEVRQVLDRVSEKINTDESTKIPIRYGDATALKVNLSRLNIQNFSLPIYGFFQVDQYNYKKWIFKGNPSPNAVALFAMDHLRGKIKETLIETPVSSTRARYPLMTFSGADLKKQLENTEKDFIVNFYGWPCKNCQEVEDLFYETATWAKKSSISHVVFATVNASCNDIPVTIWRNETYPYAWMFPATNKTHPFPIGKRRSLYLMAQLLKDNSTQPIKAAMPPKPEWTPEPVKDDEL
ncbi:hypothetical protein TVAG_315140 [Trichomonas vaginalis G3]|uniref:protein disulfide-isomerase n=1 Tax=Trichomonas vaginalis (strain ATCC PRA-98 / G3) TaxID=412133 RepID=A2FDI3_TRIV3|nr:intramolecular oxidoreductase activity, transposing S-S bonds [Trichomonas vaginalis G3]EAX97012.1 hypothetical protein TVAG_315140 [Trichomonas vaginalis G3]KAI5521978.1 intramolecular oxidoreductase activity, transposing S-S bonds [Trichomonas vaginalis G3]|eukprot:XP_001309942.1 hypothetical protein [Trichomonas vaginalis G3]